MSGDQPIRGSRAFWNFSPAFLGVNVLIALLISVLSCPSCLTNAPGLRRTAEEFLISFLLSCILSYGGFLVERFFDRRISWIQYPVKRLILEIFSYTTYVFVSSYIVIFFHLLVIKNAFTLANIPWGKITGYTVFPAALALLISFLFISRSFLLEWRKSAIEAEQLKTERFAQQYQSLKDQLNPHFLFNSLNVLSNLVYENQDSAAKFIQQLSKIYRYVLDVQQEELVSLRQEIDFAQNYLSLQKLRFEESLQYEIKVSASLEEIFLPPLSLQLLLENAIKHNVASDAQPLHIELSSDHNFLIVKNNLQLKSSISEESAGVGLANISKRYELLSQQEIVIADQEGFFVVKLPLIKI